MTDQYVPSIDDAAKALAHEFWTLHPSMVDRSSGQTRQQYYEKRIAEILTLHVQHTARIAAKLFCER